MTVETHAEFDRKVAENRFAEFIGSLLRVITNGNDMTDPVEKLHSFTSHCGENGVDMTDAMDAGLAKFRKAALLRDNDQYDSFEWCVSSVIDDAMKVAVERAAKDGFARGRLSKAQSSLISSVEDFCSRRRNHFR